MLLAEGEIEVEIEGKAYRPEIGEEVLIPANASRTFRNIGFKGNVWYYGLIGSLHNSTFIHRGKLF